VAKYDERRFYWLQLKEDYFDDDAIAWLEEQPNGKEYSLFYLKLCLKSLKTNGIMIRRVGEMLIPYDHKKLAEITNTCPDTVLVAMQLLTKIGLVKTLDNGELYLSQIENLIGSQSVGAFKKQQQRQRQQAIQTAPPPALPEITTDGQGADNCPPDIEIEIEKEIDIEIEIDKERKRLDYQEIIKAYNDICISLPAVNKLSDSRKKAIKARINSGYTVEDLKKCFEKAENSSFLKGKNSRNWHADFDWLLKDANIAKVLDGKYDDYNSNSSNNTEQAGKSLQTVGGNGVLGIW
jgi:predicted phage replisome organizer